MRISDWSSDVCSSDLGRSPGPKSRAEVQGRSPGRSTGPGPTRVGRLWGRRNGGSLIMPATGGRSGIIFYCLLAAMLDAGPDTAPDADYFTPHYAASRGLTYRALYAATPGPPHARPHPPASAAPPAVPPTPVPCIPT